MKATWKDMVCMLAGLWLWISPFILHFKLGFDASSDASVVGIFIGAIAMMAVAMPRTWEERTNMALGIWLLASPWLLGFSQQVVARDDIMIVGAVVAILSLWSLARSALPQQPLTRAN